MDTKQQSISKEVVSQVFREMAYKSHHARVKRMGVAGYSEYMRKLAKSGLQKRWSAYRARQTQ
jgi:hypothetical protein